MYKYWFRLLIPLLVLLISASIVMAKMPEKAFGTVGTDSEEPHADSMKLAHASATDFTTIITVTTTSDPDDDSITRTCHYTEGVYYGTSPCSFRRAWLEAGARPATDRPILIKFNLDTSDSNYDSTNDVWEIMIENDLPELGPATLNAEDHDGFVTLDGDTQTGGRTKGPKIVLNTNYSLQVFSQRNTIKNIAIKGGGSIMLQKSSNIGGYNLVENIWSGLTNDGTDIVFIDSNNIAGGGIHALSDGNTVRNNIIAGGNPSAIRLQGNNNLVDNNQVGMRADGTVPDNFNDTSIHCFADSTPNPSEYWYGGWGIDILNGSYITITNNIIAGLHRPQSPTETHPPAITILGSNHLIANNIIGKDVAGNKIGTCGLGIQVAGYSTKILDNEIYNSKGTLVTSGSGNAAIFVNDSSPLFDQITIRGNLAETELENMIGLGPAISNSDPLKNFNPARITAITGTTVVGTYGKNSPCPNCIIELFLDDDDAHQEALQLVAVVTATANGDFTATIPTPLVDGQGIRTGSTTADTNTIEGYLVGTSTPLSKLYHPLKLNLTPGWNLFSLNIEPPSLAIVDVLQSIEGKYDVVLGYTSGMTGGGLTYDPANPDASDLTMIDNRDGYWIYITADTTQILRFEGVSVPASTEIILNEGWNLVSFLPEDEMAVSTALQSISGKYTLVQGFENGGLTYDPNNADLSDLQTMKPGFGYWIKMDESATLIYDSTALVKRHETQAMQIQKLATNDFFMPTTEWADFHGIAKFSGYLVPSNATIIAYDSDGIVAGSFSTHGTFGGEYGLLHVYGDDARTSTDEGAEIGDNISFTIYGRPAEITSGDSTWDGRGVVKKVDLSSTMPFEITNIWADFYGTLTINDQAAPIGSIIATYDSEGNYSGDIILTESGKYGFLHAYGDDSTTTADEGSTTGDTLTFKAFLPPDFSPIDLTTGEDITWQGLGSRTKVNLISAETAQDVAPTSITINGPTTGQVGTAYTFTATVDPTNVTLPITFTFKRTDKDEPLSGSLNTRDAKLSNVVWNTVGTKIITIAADNGFGVVTKTHAIVISSEQPPPANEFVIEPGGGSQTFTDTNNLETTINVGADVVSEDTTFVYTQTNEPDAGTSGFAFAGHAFQLTASQSLEAPINITIEYSDADLDEAGITDKSTLGLYYWDEDNSQWQEVIEACNDDYVRDPDNNKLTAPICHLSEFALMSKSTEVNIYLPIILK
ncbi:MAG: hypothetical protein B6242_00040 [Anaerolineaceae bacterium 4572_78]|nr:MAG: hypothetical protein B6242_00040 [Anaerolineaceae bacterium 4572_78]